MIPKLTMTSQHAMPWLCGSLFLQFSTSHETTDKVTPEPHTGTSLLSLQNHFPLFLLNSNAFRLSGRNFSGKEFLRTFFQMAGERVSSLESAPKRTVFAARTLPAFYANWFSCKYCVLLETLLINALTLFGYFIVPRLQSCGFISSSLTITLPCGIR